MKHLRDRFAVGGKAMIGVVAVPLLVPLVAASFYAIRVWADADRLNPSMESFHLLIQQTEQALSTLDVSLKEATMEDAWETAVQPLSPPPEVSPETEEPPEETRPKAFMLGDLALQGIFWKAGRPIVYVNHELVELNETVNGWKVTSISKDAMVVTDPEGNEVRYDLDTILQELYPGYQAP